MTSPLLRPLGKHGPMTSAVGYGAMSFSDFYGSVGRNEAFAILDGCRDLGISHLDTADLYGAGRSETWIGEYFAANPNARDFFQLASKGGIWPQSKQGNDGHPNSNDPAYLAERLDLSLAQLKTDHLDLYYIHRIDTRIPVEQTIETLVGFQKAGKIKHFGLSEVAPSTLKRATAVAPVAAVQNEYSLWTRTPEVGLVQACEETETAFVAFSPVGRRMLTDRPPRQVPEGSFWANNPRFQEPNLSANLAWTDAFRSYAGDKGVAAATLAIAWVLAKSPNMIAIPGTRSGKHLEEAGKAMQLKLTQEEIAEIETVLPAGFAHGDRYAPKQWRGQERFA